MKMSITGDVELRHLGVIMDGNGRWAQARGLPRLAGHQAGTEAVRTIVDASCELGIPVLTLYTFSTENWRRSVPEVAGLLWLIEEYCVRELPELHRNGIHLQLMGRREGLPSSLLIALDRANDTTRGNKRLVLNLALNYGGRTEIVDATKAVVAKYHNERLNSAKLSDEMFARHLYCPDVPDADLIIRTGGEQRLSNFLLWRAATALFWSTPTLWPDFKREHLLAAMKFFRDNSEKKQEPANGSSANAAMDVCRY